MKSIVIKLLVATAIISSYFNSVSASEFPYGKISRIYISSSTVYFRLKNDSCLDSGKYYYYHFDQGDTEYAKEQAWYSLMLEAATTQGVVHLSVPACNTGNNIQVTYIYQDF